eukprot:COSAG06_NODE_15366_length_1076_cov_2.142272_2_plen_37_part_01
MPPSKVDPPDEPSRPPAPPPRIPPENIVSVRRLPTAF